MALRPRASPGNGHSFSAVVDAMLLFLLGLQRFGKTSSKGLHKLTYLGGLHMASTRVSHNADMFIAPHIQSRQQSVEFVACSREQLAHGAKSCAPQVTDRLEWAFHMPIAAGAHLGQYRVPSRFRPRKHLMMPFHAP